MVFAPLEGFLGQNQGVEQEVVNTHGKKNQSKEQSSEAGGIEVRLQEALPHQKDEPEAGHGERGSGPRLDTVLLGGGGWAG